MLAQSLLALAPAALAACSARGDGREDRGLSLPDVPEDLLAVPGPRPAASTVSLRDGTVVGVLTTTRAASGEPAAFVYRCLPDAAGVHRWTVLAEGGLAPLAGASASRGAALRVRAIAELPGDVDAQAQSPNEGSVPLYRYRLGGGLYVLRLDTRGGLGPADEGAACAAGSPDVRSPVSADFYFVGAPGYR